jgi:hypothetical protein
MISTVGTGEVESADCTVGQPVSFAFLVFLRGVSSAFLVRTEGADQAISHVHLLSLCVPVLFVTPNKHPARGILHLAGNLLLATLESKKHYHLQK